MLFAAALALNLASCVPARWPSGDPKSLDLLDRTPVNCLLLERGAWSADFAKAASARGIAALAVVRDASQPAPPVGFAAVVVEGDFDPPKTELPVVALTSRRKMRIDGTAPVIGTTQAMWPGIQIEEGGAAKAAPSGAPWIDTNAGFLRFVRAATRSTVWIANQPPKNQVIPVERYLQAVSDAAMEGARWVVALDPDFARRLLAGDGRAVRDFRRIAAHLKFYEDHAEWRALQPAGQLALIQDAANGGLISGGILDMIAARHTPVRAVAPPALSDEAMRGAKMAVDVDPGALTPEQKETLRRFTRSGGTLLSGPPGWKFESASGESITLDKEDIKKLDAIWREVNSATGHRNFGARLFNVSSMLSNLLSTADGKRVVLQLVNYANFPAEDITIHVAGTFTKATLYLPEGEAKPLAPYAVEEGTAIEIARIPTAGAIVLE